MKTKTKKRGPYKPRVKHGLNGTHLTHPGADNEPLFKVEYDPTIEALQTRGAVKHLVPSLVDAMEKMEVGKGHVKIGLSPLVETEANALSLWRGAKKVFDSNKRNKHFFRMRVHKDAKERFVMIVIKRIA